MQWRITLFVGVPLLLASFSAVSARAAALYFTDPGFGDQIGRIGMDGDGLETVVAFPSIVDPRALAIDEANGHAYFSSGSVLQRVRLDGTGLEPLGAAGGGVPTDIELDVDGNAMFWSVDGSVGVQSATLEGAGRKTLVSQSLLNALAHVDPRIRADNVSSIALDVAQRRFYWANGRHLNSAPLSGVVAGTDAVHHFELTGDGDITRIALDVDAAQVYWTNNAGSAVQRARLTGGEQTTLVSRGFGRPSGLALDLVNGRLYFGDAQGTEGRGELVRADLDGSHVQVIYDSHSRLFAPHELEIGPAAISTALDGDFDEDGDVDGDDFERWATNLGLAGADAHLPGGADAHSLGDADADDDVDGSDLLVWQRQFGEGLGGEGLGVSAAAAMVPEPAATSLVLLAVAEALRTRGRKSSSRVEVNARAVLPINAVAQVDSLVLPGDMGARVRQQELHFSGGFCPVRNWGRPIVRRTRGLAPGELPCIRTSLYAPRFVG